MIVSKSAIFIVLLYMAFAARQVRSILLIEPERVVVAQFATSPRIVQHLALPGFLVDHVDILGIGIIRPSFMTLTRRCLIVARGRRGTLILVSRSRCALREA